MNKTLTKLGSSQKQVTDILEFFQAEEVECHLILQRLRLIVPKGK